MDPSLLEFLNKGGIVGALVAAVYYVARKLSATYESRIQALEKASAVCEADRIELRNMILRNLKVAEGTTFSITPEVK